MFIRHASSPPTASWVDSSTLAPTDRPVDVTSHVIKFCHPTFALVDATSTVVDTGSLGLFIIHTSMQAVCHCPPGPYWTFQPQVHMMASLLLAQESCPAA